LAVVWCIIRDDSPCLGDQTGVSKTIRFKWNAAMLDYETLLADASRLPLADRIQLILALWDTVPPDSLPPLSDEWLAEINRRSAEYDSGAVQTVPWEQIRADALRRVGAAESNATD
jgi:putative addiction module component (TIGR02574 family)